MSPYAYYNGGASAHLTYRAPSGTAVVGLSLGPSISHFAALCGSYLCSRAFFGITNPGFSAWEPGVGYFDGDSHAVYQTNPYASEDYLLNRRFGVCRLEEPQGASPFCNPLYAGFEDHNYASFGLQANLNANIQTSSGQPSFQVGYAGIALIDRHPPYLAGNLPTNRDWFDDGGVSRAGLRGGRFSWFSNFKILMPAKPAPGTVLA